ncbi:MAG: DNA adenine methylase [Nitrospinae bacterium]|nr:DNA adenine methylase [Nitrospinota bacterium]MBF0634797.1 DNA adenine methylase [Nitrospinota bacterium]
MYSNKLYTPLRYPGGKARFAPFIAEVIQSNGLATGHYLEPYAGGAGVALELLFHGHASHVHINDLDPAVNAFWIAVTRHPESLLKLLHDTPVTMEQWRHWRAVMRGEVPADVVESGFATLFMNRTNRSGILKGGVIGGKAQTGNYKLDERLKKGVLASRIERIATHAESISVYCEDARQLLLRCAEFLPPKSLIYLDPPYYVKGRGLYRNFYNHDDHVAIAKVLQSRIFKQAWIVSYDNTQEICRMYRKSQGFAYGINYTAQERYVGNEVMFFSRRLSPPETELSITPLVALRNITKLVS